MKTQAHPIKQKTKFLLCSHYFIMLLFLLPVVAFGQKQKDIIPILECVEDLGDGRFIANFGYDNPNGTEIILPEDNSTLIYNNGNTKEKTLNKFKSGRQYKVVVKEFNGGDMCTWRIILPNETPKETTASVNSSHCSPSYNIEGYYPAPAGGKLNNSLIGPELTGLNKLFSSGNTVSSNDIFQISDDGQKVLIEILPMEGKYQELDDLLRADYGFYGNFANDIFVKGFFPIGDLLLLNKLPKLIVFARPFYPAINNVGTVLTQGDKSLRSDFVKGGYNIFGEGVNIGVISNSFNTKKVNNLDQEGLGNVTVLKDLTVNATDEGRAMLEIVRDIAPQANLFFRTGVLGPEDMVTGIKELKNRECNVIVDDVTYITEPFFRDGQVAQAVNAVVSEGVTYFTSAGNFGSASYTSPAFKPVNAPRGITGLAHDFGGGDIFQNISLKPGTYTIVLQWDELGPARTDLDIYLTEIDGANLLGYNRVNTGGEPIEVLPFTVSGTGAKTNIMITRASGTTTPRFKYIVFRGSLGFHINEYGVEGSSTITGHANAAGAITVGAVRFDKTPAFGKDLKIMSYSSTGGTPIAGETELRQKPDITAPNGVNTSVDLGNGDWDDEDANQPGIDDEEQNWPNFFGTSAAAPHAAAVAALLIQANEMYNHEPDAVADPMSRDDIWEKLTSTALDDDSISGVDHIMGHGFIQADAAMAEIANPKPTISGIVPPANVNQGDVNVTFSVIGNYFVGGTEGSKIYCRGIEIPTTFISETKLQGTISLLEGNPMLHVETPFKSASELDGGSTQAIPFSQEPKMKVSLLVENEERFFGQNNPTAFTYSFEVKAYNPETEAYDMIVSNPPLLDSYMPSLIDFITPSSTDDIGIWGINAELTGPIPQVIHELYEFEYEDKTDPNDPTIFKRVNNYGLLTINKLPVTITAVDKTLTYGDDLSQVEVSFTYDFNGALKPEEEAAVKVILNDQHGNPAKTNGLVITEGIVLQNGLPLIGGSAINNGVQLISGLAIVDGWEIVVDEVSGNLTMTKDGFTNTISKNEELDEGDYTFINEFSFYNGYLIVNAKNIESGLAIVNGATIKIDNKLIVEVNGVSLATGLAIVDGVPLVAGLAIVDGATIEVTTNGTIKYQGLAIVDGVDIDDNGNGMINGTPVIAGLPIVNTAQIVEGLAMVNCNLNGVPTASGLAIINGAPASAPGLAIVDGADKVNGLPIVNGVPVIDGLAIINGVPIADGLAIINGLGLAIVNGKSTLTADGLAIVNGVPAVTGLAIINSPSGATGLALINGYPGGLALVNGSAYTEGLAIVNSDGSVTNAPTASGLAMVNAAGNTEYVVVNNIGLLSAETVLNSPRTVDGLAIVDAINHNNSSGLAIVNGGLAIVNANGEYGLAIVNKVESGLAMVNAKSLAEGLAIVNGAPVIEGLAIVNGTPIIDGLAIVNGNHPVEGLAIINGVPNIEGLAIVNGAVVDGLPAVQEGVIMIMDITALQSDSEDDAPVTFVPVSMITGKTAGEHWIIPAALNSINFAPEYRQGKAVINKKNVSISLSDLTHTYDGKPKQPTASTEGLDLSVHFTYKQGDNEVMYPTDAGAYTVTANIIDDNYEGTITDDLNIGKANAEITVEAYDVVYDGEAHSSTFTAVGVESTPADLTGLMDVIGTTHTDAGDFKEDVWSFTGNINYNATSGTVDNNIDKASAVISVTPYDVIYDGKAHTADFTAVGVESNPADLTGLMDVIGTTHTAAGDYTGDIWSFAGNGNYNATSGTVDNNIDKAPSVTTITIIGASFVYTGSAIKPASVTVSGAIGLSLTPEPIYANNVNSGTATASYSYAGDANHESSSDSKDFTISKAQVTIIADIGYKNEGDPTEPDLTYHTIPDIAKDEISVTLLRDVGDEPGVYDILLDDYDLGTNYTYGGYTPANFYINPWGPGTKKIRSTLMCVTDHGDYSTAIFAWNNDNSVPVYVPHGPDNYFSPDDIADIGQLPELFETGYGEFSVVYEGPSLTWTISSYESDHKSSTTTGADLNSPKCTSPKSGTIANPGIEQDIVSRDLNAYPNPTSGRVIIDFRNEPGKNEVMVYDIMGRTHELEKTWIPSSGLELNFSDVVSGIYLVKVNNAEAIKVFRIIKQ